MSTRVDLFAEPYTRRLRVLQAPGPDRKRARILGRGDPVFPTQGFWKQGFSESWKCGLALMRKLVFRDHYARVFASRSNICQVTRKPLFPKPLFMSPRGMIRL